MSSLDSAALSASFAATAGIHVMFHGKSRDQDRDGVRDWLDN